MRFSPARLIRHAAIIAVLLSPTTAHAQDITTGLIGHWTLDETSGTTATDSSSSGYNGTMTGGLSGTNSAAGQIGTSLSFDGTDDYITVGNPATYQITGSITLAAWVRGDSFPEIKHFVSKQGNTPNYGWRLATSGGSSPFVMGVTSTGAAMTDRESVTVPVAGTWYHVVGVYNATAQTLDIYVDGALDNGTLTGTIPASQFNSSVNVNIGRRSAANRYFDGNLDDVRIYNRALSAADVATLYAYSGSACSSPNGSAGEIIFNESARVLQYCNDTQWIGIGSTNNTLDHLIAHWAFDETSGTTATDSSGNSNTGTLTNMNGATDWVSGIIGGALDFDGSDDFVSVASGGSGFDFDGGTGSFSLSMWLYPTSFNNEVGSIRPWEAAYCNANPSYMFAALTVTAASDTDIRFGGYDSTNTYENTVSAANAVSLNTWSHVTFVLDRENNQGRTYINGVQSGATEDISGWAGTIDCAPATISHTIGGYGTQFNFQGRIDDVRFYDTALPASTVSSLYDMRPSCTASTSGLVGHWNLNETTGASIADSSGNTNNGVWTDGANNDVAEETVAGEDGTALSFDETDDVITVPHDATLDISTGYTVSGWVWFDSTAATSPITPSLIAKNDGGGWGHGWVMGRTTGGGNIVGGNIRLTVQHNRNISGPNSSYSGWIYPVDTWNYVTVSWDGTNVRYYLNGALVESDTITVAPDTATGDLTIGYGRSNWYTTYHAGDIDDLRLYNRALSDSEITALYGAVGGVCNSAACTSPFANMGTILYNTTLNVMQYCNGDDWIAFAQPGNGGAACTSPAGLAGELRYNSDFNVLQYCEGDQWVAVGQSENTLSLGLLGHYRLNETSGNTISDSSGNSNNATWTDGGDSVVSGGDSQASTPDGTGLNFNGHISNFIQHSTRFGNPANLTLAGWVNINSVDTSGSTLVSIGGSAVIEFFTDRVEGTFRAPGSVWRRTTYSNDILGDGWTHVVWTHDDTNNTQALYINGSSVATSAYTESIDWASSVSASTFLGKHASLNTYHLIGSMDAVRIYDRALSASEVTTLYNSY